MKGKKGPMPQAPRAKSKVKPEKKPAPPQGRLPSMEDNKLQDLEDLAKAYAIIRDKRVALSVQEGEKKKEIKRKMHDLKKKRYKRDGILIELVPQDDEKLKVRIGKGAEIDDDEGDEVPDSKEEIEIEIPGDDAEAEQEQD